MDAKPEDRQTLPSAELQKTSFGNKEAVEISFWK